MGQESEDAVGMMEKLTKFGLTKKALDEVREPENQEKIRRMAASVTNRGKKPDGPPAGTGPGPDSTGAGAPPPAASAPPPPPAAEGPPATGP